MFTVPCGIARLFASFALTMTLIVAFWPTWTGSTSINTIETFLLTINSTELLDEDADDGAGLHVGSAFHDEVFAAN